VGNPREDPSERDYRTGALPRVRMSKRTEGKDASSRRVVTVGSREGSSLPLIRNIP
jgi:hypothetical protein